MSRQKQRIMNLLEIYEDKDFFYERAQTDLFSV